MVQSITVIGGTNQSHLTGLVPVPLDNASPSGFVNSLQALLGSNSGGTGYSDSVNSGALFLNNTNIAGQTGALAFGPNTMAVPGILELTNTDTTGLIHAGVANISGSVPVNYSTLIVQAPGSETIIGNSTNGQLDIFGANSSVNFNTGGSGTIVAGGIGQYIGAVAGDWTINAGGGDTINTSANSTYLITSGTANLVGLLAGTNSVLAGGSGDIIQTYNAGVSAFVTVQGSGERILVDGGADTVTAVAGSSNLNAFFNLSGGSLDFINNSGVATTVSGAIAGAIGGSVTVFGGAGGGSFQGGPGGNNSLIGGSGLVTLIGAGTSNILIANGAGTQGNLLTTGVAGTSVLEATSSTTDNTFIGGSSGTTSIVSFGSGQQNFFVGNGDTETLTGSAAGTNSYYINQDSAGSGFDIITNFVVGRDHLYLNFNQPGVSIAGVSSLNGATPGTLVQLTDNTILKLYGVTANSLTSVVGGTQI